MKIKLNKCLKCEKEINIDLIDSWVCPDCGTLHQTLINEKICPVCLSQMIEIVCDNDYLSCTNCDYYE